jgi:nucleoside-diphosphate-sugar epimerase
MKILVTGASGFIGKNLINQLSKKHFVIGLFNTSEINFKNKNIKLFKVNLLKTIQIKDLDIDVIVHCANYTPANHKKSVFLMQKNNKIMKNILKFASTRRISKIIYFSSIGIYKIKNKSTISEKSKVNLTDHYSISKTQDEKIIKRWVEKNNNRKLLIVRTPGVVGFGAHGNFISTIFNKIKSTKLIELKIHNLNLKFNNIIHVKTIGLFITRYLSNFKKKILILNLASSYPIRVKNIVNLASKYFKKNIKLIDEGEDGKSFKINFDLSQKHNFKPLSVKKCITRYLKEI